MAMTELTQGHVFSVICYSEDHSIPVLHVNTCLSCMAQVHSLSILWNMCIANNTNIWGLYWILSSQNDKDIQRQLRYQYCAENKLRAYFSRCSNAVKNVLFRSVCTPMYASQLWCNFRKSCMQRLRIILHAGLYTTCPGERVLVTSRFNVTFLPLRRCFVNTSTCFSKDAEI